MFDETTDFSDRLDSIESKIDRVLETHQKLLDVVEEIKPEVSGVIAGLQKNPMFRMLMGGK